MSFEDANRRLLLKRGDITEEAADAIVNAANATLMGGGGVDGAIHRKGGPEIKEACRRRREELGGPLPTGQAVITTAGKLPARFVIHTVGPVYGRDPEPERKLASAYRESLRLAAREGLRTIAFPSISTGAYGYPIDDAARIALSTVLEHLDSPEGRSLEKVTFVLFSEEDLETYRRVLRELLGDSNGKEGGST